MAVAGQGEAALEPHFREAVARLAEQQHVIRALAHTRFGELFRCRDIDGGGIGRGHDPALVEVYRIGGAKDGEWGKGLGHACD